VAPGAQRQCREVVSGKETLRGEIAVWIEITFLSRHIDLQQQVALAQRLLLQSLGTVLVSRSSGLPDDLLRLLQVVRGHAI